MPTDYHTKRYRVIDLVQGSAEWHAFRKGKIGASMAPAIMGVSPFQTKLQLWEQIINEVALRPSPAMERGVALEPIAREWINQKLGKNYRPVVLQSLKHEELIASLDGYYENENGVPHLLEIKCPGIDAHLEALNGKVPDHYYPQLQHQMDLAGVNQMLYLSFDGMQGVTVPVFRDEDYCRTLYAEEWAFISSLIDLRPPKASDKDWAKIDDSERVSDAHEYAELTKEIEWLKEKAESIKRKMIAGLAHDRVLVGPLRIAKVSRKGEIDFEAIPELKGINKETYRKEASISWRITAI